MTRHQSLVDDPQWYKDAIIYELRVRSFMDSNADGIGDFKGLTEKLDYLQDLGVTALWLLPFYPSPLRDDGYDIADYLDVHPEVGTLDDFKEFLEEAHRRGLRVITELVLNHTSDQHPWFQRARRAPKGSSHRDFYVWSDTPDRYKETRIIFKDFEPSNWSWDPVAKQYFWHRFYAHQPDLNFENPDVHEALLAAVDFWFGMGVDGLRLDAVPYLYEAEGTNCENLPETHAFIKKLRAHVDSKFKNRMLLAEANQWPEDAAAYFGDGDECHMNFHFPIMPRLFMSIHMEDRFPLIDILEQTPQLHPSCQWALFLRNHDELTLEMVTDEERDYMYRAYASEPGMRINLGIRRRLAPLVGNNRRNIELMNGLLCSMPGTPVLYYGDEIGMGDNHFLGDRNGVRTPMQWSADRNAGFSRTNPQRLILPVIIDPEYHYESLNVEAQQNNPNSLLWWTKRLIALRKRYKSFGRGSVEFLHPENPRVLAFTREYEGEIVLVVANLSRFVQYVELDLARLKGMVPREMFGGNCFPPIGDLPYLLTLGPHAFYWFSLEKPKESQELERAAAYVPPHFDVSGSWEALLKPQRHLLEETLPIFLSGRRWFTGGNRQISGVKLVESMRVGEPPGELLLTLVRVEYKEGEPEMYALPLAYEKDERATEIRTWYPQAVVAQVKVHGAGSPNDAAPGVLYDALLDPVRCQTLLDVYEKGQRTPVPSGEIVAAVTHKLREPGESLEPRAVRGEHTSASVVYGDRYLLKFFRRMADGMSPELELGRLLGPRTTEAHTSRIVGAIEYRVGRSEPITLSTLQEYVPNEGNAWQFTREELGRYFERVTTRSREEPPPELPSGSLLALSREEPPPEVHEFVGAFLDTSKLLGQRLAEFHRTLATLSEDPAYTPEPYSALDQRSAYQSMRNVTGKVLRLLRSRLSRLPDPVAAEARKVLAAEQALYKRFEPLREMKLTAQRVRCHGNFHLGQVLFTGKDFVIAGLEGNRAKPLSERRRKRSPLRDVASMIRSLHSADYTTLLDQSVVREADRDVAFPWAHLWQRSICAAFVGAYLSASEGAVFLPTTEAELEILLDTFTLEKALDELGQELETVSGQVAVPLLALVQILAREGP